MTGEKTEKPTEQKKRQARKDGQIARSADLGAWAGILAASMLIPITLRIAGERVSAMLHRIPNLIVNPGMIANPDLGEVRTLVTDGALAAALAVAPLAGTLLLVGVAAAGAQGGIHIASKLMMPKLSRLSPMQGIKRTMGPHAWWEGVKALIKTVVLAGVLYSVIRGLIPVLLTGGSLPLGVLLNTVAGSAQALIRSAAIAGLVMAGADYAVVRRRTGKQLRMTKQEVKEEFKRTEGDQNVKGAIRARQFAASRNRMMAELPNADVVVVNPTHVAVALRYDPAKGAPRVIAKGRGAIAATIREKATEHRIPVIQDVPLARALHASCEVGAEIPPELYAAVARVLAFVMGLKARGSAAGTHRLVS